MTYEELLREIWEKGKIKQQRATLQDGSKPSVRSLFGKGQVHYDLSEGFPLISTKKMPWSLVAAEVLFFLRGETNIEYLHQYDCHIWDEWADANGNLGPIYGSQWRNWHGVDQLRELLENIRAVKANPYHPAGRRLMVSAWNVTDIPAMALPPCHVFTSVR